MSAPEISVTTRGRYLIEVDHPSAWSPKEDGIHLYEIGNREARKILQDLFDAENVKHGRAKFRIISHETSSVTATATKV